MVVGLLQGVGTGKGGYRLLGVLVEVYILGTRNLDPLYPPTSTIPTPGVILDSRVYTFQVREYTFG